MHARGVKRQAPSRKEIMKKKEPPRDDHRIRCPRLGHMIAFSYCYTENSGLPCFKTLDCWFQHFEVRDWLEERLSADQLRQVFEKPPKPKMLSLVELIDQARKNAAPGAKTDAHEQDGR